MKAQFASFAFAVLPLVADALAVSHGSSFGPQNCVKLTRTAEGSCVITTNCQGLDTSKTEFAFDCVGGEHNNGGIVRHSFGVGGFEANEEFDTEVKCTRCTHVPQNLPPPVPATVKKPAHTAVKKEVIREPAPKVQQVAPATEEPLAHAVPTAPKPQPVAAAVPSTVSFKAASKVHQRKAKKEVVEYGPNNCVSVYRSDEGHCIMRTACDKDLITNYEFGLVCVNKKGFGESSPVKHLFGKNSFDPEETFDTLIKCDQCLGLEDIPDKVALAGEVATMAKDISSLKDTMKNISVNVKMLNDKVFASPAPGPAIAIAAGPAPAALLHGAVEHRRTYLRAHRRHRHHRRHRDEDYDDDEDDEGYDDDNQDSRDRSDSHDRAEDARVQEVDMDPAGERASPENVMAQAANELNAVSSNTEVPKKSSRQQDDDDDRDDDGWD